MKMLATQLYLNHRYAIMSNLVSVCKFNLNLFGLTNHFIVFTGAVGPSFPLLSLKMTLKPLGQVFQNKRPH